MNMALLLPIALAMGIVGLVAFLWSLRDGQYEDMDGAAERILLEDRPEDRPAAEPRADPEAGRSPAGPHAGGS